MSSVVRSVYSACLAMIAGLAVSAGEAKPPIDTFSFIHMSDIHVDPWLVMPSMEETTSARSYRSLRTLVKRDNVFLEPYNITAPKPSFIIATGDICEFGAPGFTWDVVERYFEGLPKYYLAPGNHDNTWVFSSQYFKKKFGGFSYSFDHGGIHFICLNSASLQDPNPSFSQEVVEFVKRDLKKVDPQTPIIPYCHHPWHGAEFASRYDADRLLDLFRPYNLVMILDGTWPCVRDTGNWRRGRGDGWFHIQQTERVD